MLVAKEEVEVEKKKKKEKEKKREEDGEQKNNERGNWAKKIALIL